VTRRPDIEEIIAQADEEQLRRHLFHLSKDPLPYRKVNFTRPGQQKNSLEETDDFVEGLLREWGYEVEREPVQVQAWRCDTTKHPSHWYSLPEPEDPWYTSHNLYARTPGAAETPRTIYVLSHKDSPSWIDCPGANDNASGTVANLEVARLLAGQSLKTNVCFLFCNEEHWPWTSNTSAEQAKERGEEIAAVFNLDGCGKRSPEDEAAGRRPNTSVYGTSEGEKLADLLAALNETYDLGLSQVKTFRQEPANDDGVFLKAGFPAAIGVHGGIDWEDPTYHRPEDVPEQLDPGTLRRVAQLITAAVLELAR
jgi:hypothetical protein